MEFPNFHLDLAVRLQVWAKLQQLHRAGKTIIVVTHNILEAERVIQRACIMNYGKLQAIGTMEELKVQVEQRIKVELMLRIDDSVYHNMLKTLGEVYALIQNHCTILCYSSTTRDIIDHVLAHSSNEVTNTERARHWDRGNGEDQTSLLAGNGAFDTTAQRLLLNYHYTAMLPALTCTSP